MMASAQGSCKHGPDNFCYVCGVFLNVKSVKYTIVERNLFCSAYKAYFGVQVGDQGNSWTHHMVCGSCRSTLESWYRGERRKLKFGVPRIWREPTDHTNNFYFCMVVVTGHHWGKKTDVFDYPDLPSSLFVRWCIMRSFQFTTLLRWSREMIAQVPAVKQKMPATMPLLQMIPRLFRISLTKRSSMILSGT